MCPWSPTGSAAHRWPPLSASSPHAARSSSSGSPHKTPINVYDLSGHEGARVIAYLSYAHPEPPAPDLAILARLVATGQVDPVIGVTTSWTGVHEAITALAERRLSGKAVLTID